MRRPRPVFQRPTNGGLLWLANERLTVIERIYKAEHFHVFGITPVGDWLDRLIWEIEHYECAVAFVGQATGSWAAGTSYTVTYTPTAGNVIVLHHTAAQTNATITSISQTNVTWGASADQSSNTLRCSQLWSGLAAASPGNTITINLANAPSSAGANASEYSGLDSSAWLDSSAGSRGANSGSGTTVTTATVTPTAGRNSVTIGGCRLGNAYASGPDNSYNRLTAEGSRTETGYLIQASTSGTTDTHWNNGVSSGNWEATIATYWAASAGGRLFALSGLDGLSTSGPKQFNPNLG